MSNQSESELSLSNLGKKVAKNTLLANSNNLHQRENSVSRISIFSRTGRNCSSIFLESAGSINSDSIILDLQLLKPNLKELNLSTALDQPDLISIKLQEILNITAPGLTLILPPKIISIPYLYISESLNLKGSPGTILQIEGPGIKISQGLHGLRSSIQFSEVSFNFSYRNDSKLSMILIEAHSTDVEISDCMITCETKSTNAVCFELNHGLLGDYMNYNSRLSLNSCNVIGFQEVCRSCEGAEIEITKCHLVGCSGTAIMLSCPRLVTISHSLVEKCKKNGIEIVLPSDSSGLSTTRTKQSTGRSVEKQILIENSDIVHNQGCGFLLYSDNFAEHNYSVVLESNKFAHNKKEGIAMKHVAISSLKFTNNDFLRNHLTGCWLQKVFQLTSQTSFTISNNRFFDSFLGYGIYLYSSCASLESNEIFRNSLGGVMIAGSCENSIFDLHKSVSISSCVVQGNGENGIQVSDFSNAISIDNSRVVENSKSGLVCIATLSNADIENAKHFIDIKNSEISNNSEFAVVVVNCKCYFSKVAMIENGKGDVEVGENSKGLVKFEGDSQAGDSELVVVKTKRACRAACNVF